jgi:tRNA nucleotidyltransferase (CCA-adding enzyme)
MASAVITGAQAFKGRGWEQFPHDADVGLRGFGPTVEAAFEQAALALIGIVTDAEIAATTKVEVECEASDIELLLVEWLNAVIYEMAVRSMLFGRFEVKIAGTRLRGVMWGEPIDLAKHSPACEPKGATYTALRVAQGPEGLWSAGCVIDV